MVREYPSHSMSHSRPVCVDERYSLARALALFYNVPHMQNETKIIEKMYPPKSTYKPYRNTYFSCISYQYSIYVNTPIRADAELVTQ
ncbi:MAG: hypothetical protein NVS4B11_07720 [Ktedonobacteraceae bacterium]